MSFDFCGTSHQDDAAGLLLLYDEHPVPSAPLRMYAGFYLTSAYATVRIKALERGECVSVCTSCDCQIVSQFRGSMHWAC